MDAPVDGSLPTYLAGCRPLGRVAGHVCLEVEPRIYAYWLEGHFSRAHLDELVRLSHEAAPADGRYASISFTDRLGGYDADLRTVMTAPGSLTERRATASVVVSTRPLERMVVQTMSLAGKAAGSPGGHLIAAGSFEEALALARRAIA